MTVVWRFTEGNNNHTTPTFETSIGDYPLARIKLPQDGRDKAVTHESNIRLELAQLCSVASKRIHAGPEHVLSTMNKHTCAQEQVL